MNLLGFLEAYGAIRPDVLAVLQAFWLVRP